MIAHCTQQAADELPSWFVWPLLGFVLAGTFFAASFAVILIRDIREGR